jgi:adenylosuccinate lyase
LDDSAAKRIVIPEAFMAADAVIDILRNIAGGLVVYKKVIHAHIMAEIPFMATENIIMAGVKNRGDRQQLHEQIRIHSMEAAKVVKQQGKPNDLLRRIAEDPAFGLTKDDIESLLDPALYTGRSASQVEEFTTQIKPLISKIGRGKTIKSELSV